MSIFNLYYVINVINQINNTIERYTCEILTLFLLKQKFITLLKSSSNSNLFKIVLHLLNLVTIRSLSIISSDSTQFPYSTKNNY